jgi:Arc/MetJ-type ribon-helix-helix transcriptional regulator
MMYNMKVAAGTFRFSVSIPTDLFEELERARGYESRSSYVRRALERALRGEDMNRGGAAQTARPTDHEGLAHGQRESQQTER